MDTPRKRPGKRATPRVAPSRAGALASLRILVESLRQSARAIEERTGVTNAQLFLLQQLAETPGLSINELAARALTKQSTVSIVVSRLVDEGLVAKGRSTTDGRAAVVVLTPAGRRLLRRAPAPPTKLLIDAIQALPDRDVADLANGLAALLREMALETRQPALLFERPTGDDDN
jgi:DNA-binding MarR family transcriptional regulator